MCVRGKGRGIVQNLERARENLRDINYRVAKPSGLGMIFVFHVELFSRSFNFFG